MIARPDVSRGTSGGWQIRAVLYTTAAVVSAAASGLALGALGAGIEANGRIAVATFLAAAGLLIGVLRMAGARVVPLQCDRETPQRWLHDGLHLAAIKNGLALGNGASTRLGFWSWYLIPLSALFIGDPLLGAAIYGTYGVVRAGSAWVWIALSVRAHRRGSNPSEVPDRILGWSHVASYVATAQLAAVTSGVLVAIGL